MLNKRQSVRWFINWTDSWNEEVQEAIEGRVHTEYARMLPNAAKDPEMIERMRTFYCSRMMNTATLLVTISSLVVSTVVLGH